MKRLYIGCLLSLLFACSSHAGQKEFPLPRWIEEAIFYQIYPQSFQDTNGDGIGDIQGIISRLDYIHSLGCNTIWLNPCFHSAFMDAGYDVIDFIVWLPVTARTMTCAGSLMKHTNAV